MLYRFLTAVLLIPTLYLSTAWAAQDLRYFLTYAGSDTNHLVLDKQFRIATERFFHKHEDAYLTARKQLTSKTMIEALHGPPDKIRVIHDRYLIASACRAHSCPEKGLVVMDTKTGDMAYAIVHYSMDWSKQSDASYNQSGLLTVFFRKGAGDAFKDFVQLRVKEWQASFRGSAYNNIVTLIPATVYLK